MGTCCSTDEGAQPTVDNTPLLPAGNGDESDAVAGSSMPAPPTSTMSAPRDAAASSRAADALAVAQGAVDVTDNAAALRSAMAAGDGSEGTLKALLQQRMIEPLARLSEADYLGRDATAESAEAPARSASVAGNVAGARGIASKLAVD